ncbi:MAG: PAS domain-containing sensor histidine kinase [Deltaproteobacteria bacterium]|nr:PAS domain-containing sensor histidine kinase [Deltaproteobacteria bacterium]MDQ3297970.1 PAS domain-containing sensor histidine kinase [Myxococcota bacterium]
MAPERDDRLKDFVETAAIGLHWVGADGTILWANPRDYEPLGYTEAEYIGHNITEFHVDALVIEDILKRLGAGERIHDYQARLRCKDGSIRTVAITSSVLFDGEQFVHTRCFTRDITEQKEAEEKLALTIQKLTAEVARRERVEDELRRANVMKDEFLAVASHELRTPLQTLKLATESVLANSDASFDDRTRRRLSTMDRQANRLVHLVNTLLDVSQLTAGMVVLERTAVDLAALVRTVIDRVISEVPDVDIKLRVAEGALIGQWDSERLEQAISNLVGNAVKYGAGKPIEVHVMRVDDRARLEVRDLGIGIAVADQARIFQRFERAVPATHYTGFGVGLWIVRQFAEAHGGTVGVVSELGSGATFILELPLT